MKSSLHKSETSLPDVFSTDRPGSLYAVPSRLSTTKEFHKVHKSYYEKRKAYTLDKAGAHDLLLIDLTKT